MDAWQLDFDAFPSAPAVEVDMQPVSLPPMGPHAQFEFIRLLQDHDGEEALSGGVGAIQVVCESAPQRSPRCAFMLGGTTQQCSETCFWLKAGRHDPLVRPHEFVPIYLVVSQPFRLACCFAG